jgi:GDP-4-dehydro-6-deoxy-D-mannose reductase
VRDFLDVRDVADAYLALVASDTAAGVVNVCSGAATELRVLAALLVEQARVPVAIVRDPTLERGIDPPRVVGDPARLRELTGWRPRVTLEQSVAEMLALARERVPATAGAPA